MATQTRMRELLCAVSRPRQPSELIADVGGLQRRLRNLGRYGGAVTCTSPTPSLCFHVFEIRCVDPIDPVVFNEIQEWWVGETRSAAVSCVARAVGATTIRVWCPLDRVAGSRPGRLVYGLGIRVAVVSCLVAWLWYTVAVPYAPWLLYVWNHGTW